MEQRNQQHRWHARAACLALLVLVLLAASACRGQAAQQPAAQDVQIALHLSPNRPSVGPATITVQLRDAAGRPIEGAKVEVEGTMTHAGMLPVITRAKEVGDGRYVVEDFEFTMAGDWVLIVQAELPSGAMAERTFAVPGIADKNTPHDHRSGTGG